MESCFRFVAEQFDRQQQDKVEDEDYEDQQGADTIGDGIAVRHEARTHEVPEVDGQRLTACHDVRVEHVARYRRACRENQDGRLAECAARRQRDARDDARHGARQHDLKDRLELRRTECEACLFIRLWHRADGFLRHAHEHRQVQEDECQGAAEDGEAHVHHVDEDDHAEQAEYDGRHRREALDREADALRQLVLPRVLRKVDASTERDWDGDGHREEEHVERVEELRADAAARHHVARLAEDEVRREDRQALVEKIAEEGSEQAEDEESHEPETAPRDLVL